MLKWPLFWSINSCAGKYISVINRNPTSILNQIKRFCFDLLLNIKMISKDDNANRMAITNKGKLPFAKKLLASAPAVTAALAMGNLNTISMAAVANNSHKDCIRCIINVLDWLSLTPVQLQCNMHNNLRTCVSLL